MPDELRRIGAQMANVMYNLAQRPGDALTPETVAMMDGLRKDWDAAVSASRRPGRPEPDMPDAIRLLAEARAALETWKDVAPAVSLCADIDKLLAGGGR